MDFERFRSETMSHFGSFVFNAESPLDFETQFLCWDSANPWFDLCRLWYQIHGSYACRRVIINFRAHLIDNPTVDFQFDELTSIRFSCVDGFITEKAFIYSLNRKKRRRFGSDMTAKKFRSGSLGNYTIDVDIDVDSDVDVDKIFLYTL